MLAPAKSDQSPSILSTVCVVVAARNEAAVIGQWIRGILAQDYPADRLDVVVVDDRSTDATGELVEAAARVDPRVRLVRVERLPAGWMGKSHALWRGTRDIRAEWLLFTDADCQLDPAAVRTAILEAQSRGVRLLSLWPRNAAGGFWEHLVIPLCGGVIALWYSSARAASRSTSARPFANGQFLLIERAAYERIGGHQSVRRYLIEDVPLAEQAHRSGVSSWVASGRDVFGVRMYQGLGEALDGWARIFAGALRCPTKLAVSILWLVAGSLLPFVAAPWLLYHMLSRAAPAEVSTLLFAGMCVQHLLLVIIVSYGFWGMGGCDRRYLWLYPLSVLMVVVILARAWWWLTVRRRVIWRNTSYRIDRHGRLSCAS